MIDIVINNFRRLQYLEMLIKAIEERTVFPYRIIVVDNSSTAKTKAFIEDLKKKGSVWKAVYNKKNYTLPQSLKTGVKLVESEYCILTIDDIVPPWGNPCWLTHLDFLIRANKDYGAICMRNSKCFSRVYGAANHELVEAPLDNSLEKFKAIEEFLQIVKTEDLRLMILNHRNDKIEQLGFGHEHVWVRTFARRLSWFLNKKVGKPPADFPLRTIIWRDPNLGYEENLPVRDKFDMI